MPLIHCMEFIYNTKMGSQEHISLYDTWSLEWNSAKNYIWNSNHCRAEFILRNLKVYFYLLSYLATERVHMWLKSFHLGEEVNYPVWSIPGPLFTKKTPSYQYRDSHHKLANHWIPGLEDKSRNTSNMLGWKYGIVTKTSWWTLYQVFDFVSDICPNNSFTGHWVVSENRCLEKKSFLRLFLISNSYMKSSLCGQWWYLQHNWVFYLKHDATASTASVRSRRTCHMNR